MVQRAQRALQENQAQQELRQIQERRDPLALTVLQDPQDTRGLSELQQTQEQRDPLVIVVQQGPRDLQESKE